MNKFESEPKCDKCDSAYIQTKYQASVQWAELSLPEHLAVTCGNCGWRWSMEVKKESLTRLVEA